MRSNILFALIAIALGNANISHATPQTPASSSSEWRDVEPDNLVLIDVKYGQIAIELAPVFAPNHVARLRKLIRARFYDGLSFYRVVDGFVAQGGIDVSVDSSKSSSPEVLKKWPRLKAEFDQPIDKSVIFTTLGNVDLFAPEVGHIQGFPAGRDTKEGRMWPLHCPGTFAFARAETPDTANTEFYVVIGQRPARLERNLSAFGHVIDGMQFLQKLQRGDPNVEMGVIKEASKRDAIIRIRLASDVPAKERPKFQVMRTDSETFEKLKDSKRKMDSAFFVRKPVPILDPCGLAVPAKRL